MSLTDVDKGALDRGAPQTNSSDVLIDGAVRSHGTVSTNYTTDAITLSQVQDAKNGQFTITQVGNFTTTQSYAATNPGAGNYAANFVTLYQQPHGLSALPGILAYEQSGSGQYSPMPLTKYAQNTPSDAVWYTFYIFVDSTNVTINLQYMIYGNISVTFNPGFIFKWYLTYQTSN